LGGAATGLFLHRCTRCFPLEEENSTVRRAGIRCLMLKSVKLAGERQNMLLYFSVFETQAPSCVVGEESIGGASAVGLCLVVVGKTSFMNASAFWNQASANSFASSPSVSKLTTTKPEPNKFVSRSR
jgi:hypothetical protein